MTIRKIKFSTLLLLSTAIPILIVSTSLGFYWLHYIETKEMASFKQKCSTIVNEYTNQLIGPLIFSDYPSVVYNILNAPKDDLISFIEIKDVTGRKIVGWGQQESLSDNANQSTYENKEILMLRKESLC